jgi:(p)ppGpp synthase/HD superfamily hydrolase
MKQYLLESMIRRASALHVRQFDRGGLPYILHPLKVMEFLGSDADEELKCIAVGHDLIEDTDYSFEQCVREFGPRIADGILALTKTRNQPYEDYKKAVMANFDAVRVKMCDLRHNMDITRLNKSYVELTEKDYDRMIRYMQFYIQLEEIVRQKRVDAAVGKLLGRGP